MTLEFQKPRLLRTIRAHLAFQWTVLLHQLHIRPLVKRMGKRRSRMDIQQVLSRKRVVKMNIAITYILVSVILGAVGQLLLKQGMGSMGPMGISINGLGGLLWKIGTNPYVVSGLFIYVLGTLFWLVALSRVELSFAYPFASLSYLYAGCLVGIVHGILAAPDWDSGDRIGVLLISRG
jgi:hypothetical protein